ncbi:MAG: SDR family NAD(P)-dependent oxidoreductase [Bacteroidaceae bacterium]|nr:SDR family NAD(P)-dependent oxidoreductase [Bacteroidaceae bacterium]
MPQPKDGGNAPPSKTIIITGIAGGMGTAAAKILTAEGWHVIGVDINEPSAACEFHRVNLASHTEIKRFVESLQGRRIDALFNNAGVLPRRYTETEEGMELTWAVNYLAAVRLAELIIPLMPNGGHIVSMVSLAAWIGKRNRQMTEKNYSQVLAYADSKLALKEFSKELAKKHPHIYINVADPGIVDTGIIRMDRWFDRLTNRFSRWIFRTPEQGVMPAIKALHAEETMKCYK